MAIAFSLLLPSGVTMAISAAEKKDEKKEEKKDEKKDDSKEDGKDKGQKPIDLIFFWEKAWPIVIR